VFRIFLLQVLEGSDGIRWFRKAEFYIGGFQVFFILNSQLYEMQPVIFVEQGMIGFEWILRGNHEPNLLEVSFLNHVAGYDQVAIVNGIERPEIKPNFHKEMIIN
jgi:hypothetical protein